MCVCVCVCVCVCTFNFNVNELRVNTEGQIARESPWGCCPGDNANTGVVVKWKIDNN